MGWCKARGSGVASAGMWIAIGLGLIAMGVSTALWAEPARELVIKLGTLMDWARRTNPELFASRLAPITPFIDAKKFALARVTSVLRADMSEFGVICQRLQRECKQLDRRGHIALWPMLVYMLGLGAWWFLHRA
jgi:hypothetical protein